MESGLYLVRPIRKTIFSYRQGNFNFYVKLYLDRRTAQNLL